MWIQSASPVMVREKTWNLWCRYSEDRVPRVQASSQGNGSRLLAKDSSEATMCPRGSDSRSRLGAAPRAPRAPVAGDSTGAAMCHLGSSTHLLAQGSSGAAMCHLGSADCKQINKYPLTTRPS
jgi:hypothetical protein